MSTGGQTPATTARPSRIWPPQGCPPPFSHRIAASPAGGVAGTLAASLVRWPTSPASSFYQGSRIHHDHPRDKRQPYAHQAGMTTASASFGSRRRAPEALPYELWTRIFTNLDILSPRQFSLTCKRFRRISEDPHSRAAWLIRSYGPKLALYHAFRAHRQLLTPEVASLMISSSCSIPRFLVQWVDKEYHRTERSRRPVSAAVFVYFMNAGYKAYGADADFKEDDVARFERSIYSSTSTVAETVDIIKCLVLMYRFVPVRGLGSPVDETVYLVSKLDMSIVPLMVQNGLDLASINDLIMERVLWRADVSEAVVQSYLTVGFRLTPNAVKRGLQMARQITLDVLRARVPPDQLQRLAEEAVFDMFGPSVKGWSFTPEAMDFLTAAFIIPEEVMEVAILRLPNSPSDGPDSFPATRCYMKSNPCPAWKWILKTFGPSHRFTMACFDDALSRAAAERDLHALHDVYLDAGVQFRPRHVKILACRVLHRDMTANALHLLQEMRSQVTSALKDQIGRNHPSYNQLPSPPQSPSSPTQHVSFVPLNRESTPSSASSSTISLTSMKSLADASTWLKALKDEITENEEWDNRMRTTQLEGGPRGGAYRIPRPPDDALRFLEEAREFVSDLSPPLPPAMPFMKRGPSNASSARGAKANAASNMARGGSAASSSASTAVGSTMDRNGGSSSSSMSRRPRAFPRAASTPATGAEIAAATATAASTATQPFPQPQAPPDQPIAPAAEPLMTLQEVLHEEPLVDDEETEIAPANPNATPAAPPANSTANATAEDVVDEQHSSQQSSRRNTRGFSFFMSRVSAWFSSIGQARGPSPTLR